MATSSIKILRVGVGDPKQTEGVFDVFFGEGWLDWTRIRLKPTGYVEHVAGEERSTGLLRLLMKQYLFG